MTGTFRGVPVRAFVIDGAITLALGAVCWWEYRFPMNEDFRVPNPVWWVSVFFSVVTFLPVMVRRLYPLTAFAVSAASATVPILVVPVWALFYSGTVPVLFLLYAVARHRGLRAGLLCGSLLLAGLGADTAVTVRDFSDVAFGATFAALAVTIGVALRRSAEQRVRLADLLAQLETEQADRDRLAVLDERAGLARDLHDVVAHAVSLMLVQAGAARMAVADDPGMARQFLLGVQEAGRQAIGDLRHLLGVLRTDTTAVEPAAGLAHLDVLVDRMRAAGLAIEMTVTGRPPRPDAGLDVAAFRIVQEALTNVVKHAGPTRVGLEIECGHTVVLRVTDDGPIGAAPQPTRSGHGLVGMAERVALFGGRLQTGPHGPGYRVEAILPLPADS